MSNEEKLRDLQKRIKHCELIEDQVVTNKKMARLIAKLTMTLVFTFLCLISLIIYIVA